MGFVGFLLKGGGVLEIFALVPGMFAKWEGFGDFSKEEGFWGFW